MSPTVTAVVVARAGAEHLRRTLDALDAQSRAADRVLVVDAETDADTRRVLDEREGLRVVKGERRAAFGAAVAAALDHAGEAGEGEWIWLLAQDTAPEPGALAALLAAVEVSPSVAVAGPKQVDWDDPELIRGLGVSMTRFGAAVPLVEDELDQAQHDHRSDVLAVAPGGLLARRALWEALGGLDPALAVVDDGLDFGVRARLAGYRLVLVPDARVAVAGDGVAGPQRSRRSSARRRLTRQRRTAQLHRRLAYARRGLLVLHWLTLVPLAVLRSLGRLVTKDPGAIGGEFAAALRVAFSFGRMRSSRRTLARVRRVGWSAIAPLRVPQAEVRRARALRREAARARRGEGRVESRFFSGGGAVTVFALAVAGVALFSPLLGSSVVTGGSFLPLGDVGSLWAGTGYGWRDAGGGFVGAADPFSFVLAILGSLTFWEPSFVLVLLVFAALPLAGLAAWLCVARLTERTGLRVFAAVLWAFAPPLLSALQDGRPAAVLAHLLLPWVFLAGMRARRSWTAAAATGLLSAALLACAPSLAPALAVCWIVAAALAGRRFARILAVALPTLALFAPLAIQQTLRGTPLAVLADPGAPLAASTAAGSRLAFAFPGADPGGWGGILDGLGLSSGAADILLIVLVGPLAVLALLGLFLPGTARRAPWFGLALLGLATAVAASRLALAATGGEDVPLWPGAGQSLFWLGLVAAATLALAAIGAAAVAAGTVSFVFALVAVAPTAAALPLGASALVPGDTVRLPAIVAAEAADAPRVGTLVLVPRHDGSIAADLVRGDKPRLDTQTTLRQTAPRPSARERSLSRLVGNLASRSGLDSGDRLRARGVGFVLVRPVDDHGPARDTADRARSALDGNPRLVPVGTTAAGTLWSFPDGAKAADRLAAVPATAGGAARPLIWIGQAIVLGLVLLLSVPAGALAVPRESSRPGPVGRPRRAGRAGAAPPVGAGAGTAESSADGGTPAGAESATGAEAPDEDAPDAESTDGDAETPAAEAPDEAAPAADEPEDGQEQAPADPGDSARSDDPAAGGDETEREADRGE